MGPLLIVFLRKPEIGKVKTRLAATVGPEKALDVYVGLLAHTLGSTEQLRCTKQAWYTGEGSVDAVFQNKTWSTDSVARETLEDLGREHKRVHMLLELIDVDTEQDLIDTNWDQRDRPK